MRRMVFVLYALISLTSYADPVTVPNTFSAGTPAKASEVNANFTALANAVNDAPKPLMVYDSTGKVVGRYVAKNPYAQMNGQDFVIIDTGGFTFAVSFFTSYQDTETPIFTWGNVSTFRGTYGYASGDCTGTAYLMPESQNTDKLMNYAFVRYPTSIATIGSKDYQRLNINSVAVGIGNEMRCETGVGTAGRYWVSPILGNFDLSVFTPPFSVH